MVDKIGLGTPPVTPVARVADRAARPQYPRKLTERVKAKVVPVRDEFVATGERLAPTQPNVYDRSVQWQQQIFAESPDVGNER